MKKYIISLTGVILAALLLFSGCTAKNGVKFEGSEIVKTDSGMNIKFRAINETGDKISSLKIGIDVFDSSDKKIGTVYADYPIALEKDEDVILTAKSESECVKACVSSCSFVNSKGKAVSYKIKNGAQISYTETTTDNILTRAALAENLIEDLKKQFRKEGFSATGEYYPEKNQLVIATYFRNTYENCYALYQKDTTPWDKLGEEMAQTSKTCLEEFKNNSFNDVTVTVGMLSSDDQLMISATDGEIVDMFN